MSEYCKNCFEFAEKLTEKEQECEELKEENQKLEMQLCNDCAERDDYNIPCKMIRDLDYGLQKEIEDNDRYRKALEEIEKQEWTQKINNCVLDENSRPDCKLILYKDQQNALERGRSNTMVMPMPIYVGR